MSIIRRGGAHILKLIESGADPAVIADHVQVYSKDDAGTAQLFAMDGAGAVYQLTPSSGGASSVVVTDEALDVDPNLSTEGTVDWYAQIAATNPPQGANTSIVHSKNTGGWIFNSFAWVFAGGAPALDAPTSNTRSTTAADSLASAALVANNVVTRMANSAATGWGFMFRVPAPAGIARTLRVRTSVVEATMDFTASLTDGSATDTQTLVGAPSTSRIVVVNYTSATDCELVFRAHATANGGVGNSIRFNGATLA